MQNGFHVGIMGKDFNIKCCNLEGAIPILRKYIRRLWDIGMTKKKLLSKRNKLGLPLLKWANVIFETRF